MAKQQSETEGHDHEVTTEKVKGKDQVVLKRGCKRCDQIRKARQEAAQPKVLTEMQGHNHKARVWKVYNGKQLVILQDNCPRCEAIKAEREARERLRQSMAPGRLHHPDFAQRLRKLEDEQGCKIVKNRNGTFYDITAPDGGNIRISTGKMNRKQKDEFTAWLSKHNL